MKYLFYVLATVGLAYSVHFEFKQSYLTASLIAALIHVVIWTCASWLAFRGHRGTALGMLWGAACTGPAVFFNSHFTTILEKLQLQWLDAAGFAPITEETLKFIGVLLICTYFIKPQRTRDFVYVGIAVGMGFAVVEDCTFFARLTLQDLDSDLMGATTGVLIRFMSCTFAHSLFTGIAAYGLARGRALAGWMGAVTVHVFQNLFPSLDYTFADSHWPKLAALAVVGATWIVALWFIVRHIRQSRRERGSSRRVSSKSSARESLLSVAK